MQHGTERRVEDHHSLCWWEGWYCAVSSERKNMSENEFMSDEARNS